MTAAITLFVIRVLFFVTFMLILYGTVTFSYTHSIPVFILIWIADPVSKEVAKDRSK